MSENFTEQECSVGRNKIFYFDLLSIPEKYLLGYQKSLDEFDKLSLINSKNPEDFGHIFNIEQIFKYNKNSQILTRNEIWSNGC
jgi:hypothetical protein